MNITAVIVIRNEAKNLVRYFEHVKRFCNEIIVVDQQSTDNSLEIAMRYANLVFLSKNVGYNEMDRTWAVSIAKNDWVCTLDPDEMFQNEFVEALPTILETCEKTNKDGISCRIQNIYDGIEIGFGGFDQIRIAKKTVGSSTRIHTGFATNNQYTTTYKQYHFKDFDTTMENNKRREQFYAGNMKEKLNKYYNDVKEELEKRRNLNSDALEKVMKKLELSPQIRSLVSQCD